MRADSVFAVLIQGDLCINPFLPDYCVRLKFRHEVTWSEAQALIFRAILEILQCIPAIARSEALALYPFLELGQNWMFFKGLPGQVMRDVK